MRLFKLQSLTANLFFYLNLKMAFGWFRKIRDGVKKAASKVGNFVKGVANKVVDVGKKILPAATNLANKFAPQLASNPYGAAALGALNAGNALISNSGNGQELINNVAQQYGPRVMEKLSLR